jgi:ornithine--oxo-acid transaminase
MSTPQNATNTKITSSKQAIDYEHEFAAHNYHPIPVVFKKASGVDVWDIEDKHYLDFLSCYSAVNQGHRHPKIIQAAKDQLDLLTLSSRAFHNDKFAEFAKFACEYFNYENILPMNTGAEAVETGLKLARRWGYLKKGIPENEAVVGAISLSVDPESRDHFGPFLETLTAKKDANDFIRYGVIEDLKKVLEAKGDKVAAVILEPIQGEAGIVVPPKGYLNEVQSLCKQYNCLMICDEIQTGIGRTGKMLCYEHTEGCKPDVVLLGKAISGGVLPVSAVLANKDVMSVFTPGSHGSTFGGNPLSSAVAIASLEVIRDEKLTENAQVMGDYLKEKLNEVAKTSGGIISEVRGVGLLTAIVIDSEKTNGKSAWDLCLAMKDKGILAKPTHEHIIRLSPPLVITKEQIDVAVKVIDECIQAFK